MLGWFKKKFSKKEAPVQDPADLKIPVAPRPFPSQQEEDAIPSQTGDQFADESAIRIDESADSQDIAVPSTETEAEVESEYEPASDAQADQADEKQSQHSEQGLTAPDTVEKQPEDLSDLPDVPDEMERSGAPEPADEELPESSSPELSYDETSKDEDIADEATDSEENSVVQSPETVTLNTDETVELRDATAEDIPGGQEVDPTSSAPAVEVDPSLKIPVTEPKIEAKAKPQPTAKQVQDKKSLFSRLTERLSRTRESFTYRLDSLFLGKKEIDAELLDDLEELLITADLGLNITQDVLDHARRRVKRKELSDPESLKQVLKDKLTSYIQEYQQDASLVMPDDGPFVIMVVGVNGVGKTTTIGKVAHKFLQSNQSVLLVAADTFRAAAVSQLRIWGERNNVPVIAKAEGSDPSAVVYDGIAHAKAKGYDVVLVDTAGRLHTQANLMEELKKIKRVMGKQLEGAPHEVMLVVDATTGQNGISQAKLFNEAVDLTGLTLTKLDGTAKGGIVINICKELQLPIRFIGVGEQLEDLRDFEPEEFIEALFAGSKARK